MMKQILIVGAGNLYRNDDGIGEVIISKLQELQQGQQEKKCEDTEAVTAPLPSLLCADLLHIGTDGLSLLDILPNYRLAVIIDAVNMRAAPGTVKLFTPLSAKINITHDALSTHGFGLAEMLTLAEQLSITKTTIIKIIGIQPHNIAFGTELSCEVQQAIPQVIDLVNNIFATTVFL